MCSKVTCEICKKATWSGCGEHIEEALEGVVEADRCTCGPNSALIYSQAPAQSQPSRPKSASGPDLYLYIGMESTLRHA